MQVKASSLSRLSKKLGYNDFSELQSIFRGYTTQEPSFHSDKLSRILADANQNQHYNLSLMANVVHDETSNISAMLKSLPAQTLDHITTRIPHGLRQFFSLDCFLSHGLGMIHDGVDVLGDSDHSVVHALVQLKADDFINCFRCRTLCSILAPPQAVVAQLLGKNSIVPLKHREQLIKEFGAAQKVNY